METATRLRTARLDLWPMDPADAEDLFAILRDPTGWWYDPAGRHADAATTRAFAERAAARWSRDGLSYWTARPRDEATVIGLGGAQRHSSGTWNLSYRVGGSWQSRGYATELAEAGLAAARRIDPGVAVIAWVAVHNTPSRRVAERIGLREQGIRLDSNDGQDRLAYADRDLDDAAMPRLS